MRAESEGAAGTTCAKRFVHIPSERIATYDAQWGAGLLGDKAHSMVFDNTKIKRLVPDYVATIPFRQGAAEIVAWYERHPEAQQVDAQRDQLMDTMIAAYEAVAPGAASTTEEHG